MVEIHHLRLNLKKIFSKHNTFINFKNNSFRTTAVQWLRQRASTAGAWLPSLVGELRSYMSQIEVKIVINKNKTTLSCWRFSGTLSMDYFPSIYLMLFTFTHLLHGSFSIYDTSQFKYFWGCLQTRFYLVNPLWIQKLRSEKPFHILHVLYWFPSSV